MMNQDMVLIRKDGCQYLGPTYDPRTWYRDNPGKPTPYCGCMDLEDNSVYCKEHHKLMYNKGTALRKRKKDIRKKQQFEDLLQMIRDVAEELENEGWEPGRETFDELA